MPPSNRSQVRARRARLLLYSLPLALCIYTLKSHFASHATLQDATCEKPGFAAPATFAVGSRPRSIIAADFNLDGKQDLAAAHDATGDVSVVLGDGTGNFSQPATFAAGSGATATIAADFDEDGKPDLATANRDANEIALLKGDGAGSFGAAENFPVDAQPSALTLADFNLDARPDLVTTNSAADSVSLFINICGAVDLTLSKNTEGNFSVGAEGVYTLTVANAGTRVSSSAIIVTDDLPPELGFVGSDGEDWECAATGQTVTCVSDEPLAAGASASLMLRVRVRDTTQTSVMNMARVTNADDVSPLNDKARRETAFNHPPTAQDSATDVDEDAASIVIPAGAATGEFTLNTSAVTTTKTVYIYAKAGGTSKSARLTITP